VRHRRGSHRCLTETWCARHPGRENPTGPTPPEQGTVALRFGAELFEKLWQAKPFLELELELNLILGQVLLLVLLLVQYAPLRGSIAEPQG